MARIYDIGPFQLDADLGALTRAGAAVALSPRAVAVLTALAERAHRFVPKSTLMDAAWPGVIVEESNLAVQVHAIRPSNRRADPYVARARSRLETMLKQHLDSVALEQLFAAGGNISDDEACRMALEE